MTDINRPTPVKNEQKIATEDFFVYLYKKTERMVTAVYLVTNLIPDAEPLKWQMRHKTIGLLGELLPLKDMTITDRVRTRILPSLSELLSLLEIGSRAELISPMNTEILRSELSRIGTLLKERHEKKHEGGYLATDFFEHIDEKEHHAPSMLIESKGQVPPSQSLDSKRHGVKDTEQETRNVMLGKRGGSSTSSHSEEGERRRVKILAFLKGRGEVSIKDISKSITGCSEKTLQRDLGQLIKDGLVKQYGKRRWTRYVRV